MLLVLGKFHFGGLLGEVPAEQVREETKVFFKEVSVFLVIFGEDGVEFYSQISGVIYHFAE